MAALPTGAARGQAPRSARLRRPLAAALPVGTCVRAARQVRGSGAGRGRWCRCRPCGARPGWGRGRWGRPHHAVLQGRGQGAAAEGGWRLGSEATFKRRGFQRAARPRPLSTAGSGAAPRQVAAARTGGLDRAWARAGGRTLRGRGVRPPAPTDPVPSPGDHRPDGRGRVRRGRSVRRKCCHRPDRGRRGAAQPSARPRADATCRDGDRGPARLLHRRQG